MSYITEIIPQGSMPQWAQQAFDEGQFFRFAVERVAKLEALVIWMTGCGYDFCQHEHFCEQRDKLLKDV